MGAPFVAMPIAYTAPAEFALIDEFDEPPETSIDRAAEPEPSPYVDTVADEPAAAVEAKAAQEGTSVAAIPAIEE